MKISWRRRRQRRYPWMTKRRQKCRSIDAFHWLTIQTECRYCCCHKAGHGNDVPHVALLTQRQLELWGCEWEMAEGDWQRFWRANTYLASRARWITKRGKIFLLCIETASKEKDSITSFIFYLPSFPIPFERRRWKATTSYISAVLQGQFNLIFLLFKRLIVLRSFEKRRVSRMSRITNDVMFFHLISHECLRRHPSREMRTC